LIISLVVRGNYLAGYNGYLQVDGYAGYEKTSATLVCCWDHARRKFKEAEISQPKGKTDKANMALNYIQKLYRIEIQLKDKTPEQKTKVAKKKQTLTPPISSMVRQSQRAAKNSFRQGYPIL
jgi:hypothetical protein